MYKLCNCLCMYFNPISPPSICTLESNPGTSFSNQNLGNTGSKYPVLVTATPQYEISSCDDQYNITRITPFESKNIHSFVLGEPALADPLDADLPDEVHIWTIYKIHILKQ